MVNIVRDKIHLNKKIKIKLNLKKPKVTVPECKYVKGYY